MALEKNLYPKPKQSLKNVAATKQRSSLKQTYGKLKPATPT
jgi:hypothetical protein